MKRTVCQGEVARAGEVVQVASIGSSEKDGLSE